MKRILSILTTIVIIAFTSCKQEKKESFKDVEETENKLEVSYVANPDGTTVQWTAYKTSKKKPVSGVFNTINFNKKMGDTPIEALNNIEFSIPISSIFSENEERDEKLKTNFFGAMLDTELLKGKVSFNKSGACNIEITMNGESHSLPFNYRVDKNFVNLKGTMNLEDWNTLGAIESLNKVCFDLHKGEDGISKTWSDVTIEVKTTLMLY